MTSNLQFKTLAAIAHIIARAPYLEQTLQEMLRILSETLSMKRATVTLYNKETGSLFIAASHGLSREEVRRGVYRMGEGVTGKIFETARPFAIPNIHEEPLFLDRTGARRIERSHVTFVGVPILLSGEPMGVLTVDRLFGDEVHFSEDIEFLEIVATLIAQFISVSEQFKALKRENASLRYKISKNSKGLYIVGKSLAMQDVQRQMEKVAPTKATVLLLGESGTGKTLIGRIIHDLSERARFPFIKVNCAAIPENLLESELFGYEKGAFTGAAGTKPGKFEEADKGTLFLDEIGELPLTLQAKLLRVLQDREFERLGSNVTRKVDVRILAATNKNLEALVDTGHFRADLFYRLNVFPIRTPPLRERKEDVNSLLIHFLNKVSRQYGRKLKFTADALGMLRNYDWPGNVREMENLVERLVILAEGDMIDSKLIRPYLPPVEEGEEREAPAALDHDRRLSLKEMEKVEVIAALKRNKWIQQRAAKDLGLTPRQLGYRVSKYGLETLVAEQRAKSRTGE